MARRKKFETEFLSQTRSVLDNVAPKPKSKLNLKQLIRGLKSRIKRLRNWDYSWSEITELLNQQGIEISEDTLKGYLKTSRRQKLSPVKNLHLLESQSNLSPEQVQLKSDTLSENNTNKTRGRKAQPRTDISSNDSNDSTVDKEFEIENDYQPVKLTMRK